MTATNPNITIKQGGNSVMAAKQHAWIQRVIEFGRQQKGKKGRAA